MQFDRFIALGDSMTEGMTDEIIDGNFRGWADRVADVLADENPNFTYANLAIRGKLLRQVVEEQIPVALKFIEGKNTLVSFHAGANDVLRPNYKPEISLAQYERGVKTLTDAGATVILFTVVDKVDGKGKTNVIIQANVITVETILFFFLTGGSGSRQCLSCGLSSPAKTACANRR